MKYPFQYPRLITPIRLMAAKKKACLSKNRQAVKLEY